MSTKKILSILIIWTFLHVLILIFANDSATVDYDGKRTFFDSFYPMKTYNLHYFSSLNDAVENNRAYVLLETYDEKEFLVYVGSSWILFLIFKINNTSKKDS